MSFDQEGESFTPKGPPRPSLTQNLGWGFICLWLGPLLWLMWKIDAGQTSELLTELLTDSYLEGREEQIEKMLRSVLDFQEKMRAYPGVSLRGGHLIIPPEGDLIDLYEGGWVFWACPLLRDEVVRAATYRVRHRIKHYTLGTIPKLRG